MLKFEYRLCHKSAPHVSMMKSFGNKEWQKCGPEGSFRMSQTWIDAGPLYKEQFLTIAPMMAYKLLLERVTPFGMVFSRVSGKMPEHVFLVRPVGTLKTIFCYSCPWHCIAVIADANQIPRHFLWSRSRRVALI